MRKRSKEMGEKRGGGRPTKTKDFEKAVMNTVALKGFIFFFNVKE